MNNRDVSLALLFLELSHQPQDDLLTTFTFTSPRLPFNYKDGIVAEVKITYIIAPQTLP